MAGAHTKNTLPFQLSDARWFVRTLLCAPSSRAYPFPFFTPARAAVNAPLASQNVFGTADNSNVSFHELQSLCINMGYQKNSFREPKRAISKNESASEAR